MGRLDFIGVAAAALARAEDLVPRWFPGRKEGPRWVAVSPHRPGSDGGGGFSVNLHTGQWGDWAGDEHHDRGGDLISLYAWWKRISQAEACRALAAELGIEVDSSALRSSPAKSPSSSTPPRQPAASKGEDGTLVIPAPADAPDYRSLLFHRVFGEATAHWLYRDAAGAILQIVVRYPDPSKAGAKQFRPFTLWRTASGALAWRPKALPKPWPLYRLDELLRRPEAPVLVCEGEKAADAAQLLLPEFIATTSPHGAKNASSADWSPLAGRRVVIWPDHDQPGIDYATAVLRLVRGAGADRIEVIDLAWVAEERLALHMGAQ